MARKATNLELFFRTTIMLGMLVVGSLAAYRYGPPADELAALINSAAERWAKATEQEGLQPLVADTLPELTPVPIGPEEISALPAVVESEGGVVPAGFDAELEAKDPLIEPILAAGATEAAVEHWGSSGGVYRAWAVVPEGDLEKHYDTLASTPEEAASRLLAQINRTDLLR